jgi:hypothetical protein
MKIRIIEDVTVQPVLFNGTLGYNRSALLYLTALKAAKEKPGITRTQLCELLAVPMPWINRLVTPLVEARHLSETANGIRLTPKGAKMDENLPIDLREGDFLALTLDKPIYEHKVIACVGGREIWIQDRRLSDGVKMTMLEGQSFSASGKATHETRKGEKTDIQTEDLRAGTILKVNDELGILLSKIDGHIVSENGVCELRINENYSASKSVQFDIRCRLPLDPCHPNIQQMADTAIASANGFPPGAANPLTDRILKRFKSMDESERQSGRGSISVALRGGLRCEVSDLPIHPKTVMDFNEWAIWRIRQRINRHFSQQAFYELLEAESRATPGYSEHGLLRQDVLKPHLTPKQRMYLAASQDWAPLPL